jgi:hypothetical protein
MSSFIFSVMMHKPLSGLSLILTVVFTGRSAENDS